MRLSHKIALIFAILFILSVGSSFFALREMGNIRQEMQSSTQVVTVLHEMLVSLRDSSDTMLQAARQVLLPGLTREEREALYQNYTTRHDKVHRTHQEMALLVDESQLEETTKLWRRAQGLLDQWDSYHVRMEKLLHAVQQYAIPQPEQLSALMQRFEKEQAALMLLVEKALQGSASPAELHQLTEGTCVLQLWLDRFAESRKLYQSGQWDGVHPHRLSDGTLAEHSARNEEIATIVQDMQSVHTAFHQHLLTAKNSLHGRGAADIRVSMASDALALAKMSEHFRQLQTALGNAARSVAEAQSMNEAIGDFQAGLRRMLDAIVTTCAAELETQELGAVRSVEDTMQSVFLMLGGFVLLSMVLGAYGYTAYRENKRGIESLQRERELGFAQMHFLFNTFPMGCMVRDHEFRLRNCNLAAARLFGIDEQWEEMEENAQAFGLENKWEYLERYAELIYPELQPDGSSSRVKMQEYFHLAFERGALKVQWMYQTAKGQELPTEVTMLRTEWEGSPAVVYHIRDLREEQALRLAEAEAQEYMRVLFEEAPIGCHLRDAQGIPRDCNATMYTLIGARDKSEFLTRYKEIMPELQPNGQNSLERAREKIAAAFESGYQRFEWLQRRLDGELQEVEITLVRVMLHGKPALACYVQDLTAMKALLTEKNEAIQRMRILYDNAPFSCHIQDSWGNIINCNAETLRLFGLKDRIEFRARFEELSPPTQPNGALSAARLRMLQNAALETGYRSFRWEYCNISGQPFAAETTFIRVAWDGSHALACYIRPLHHERRNAVRHTLAHPCPVLCGSTPECTLPMHLVDMSFTGLRLRGDVSGFTMGQNIHIACSEATFQPMLHEVTGSVRWSSGTEMGVQLDEPLAHNIEIIVQKFNETP